MKISEKEVRYVADLANLKLTDEEVRRMASDLDGILTHMDKLNALPTDDIEPMAQVLYEAGETATLAGDKPRPSLDNETAMANAPEHGAGYYKVPLVIEK